MDKQLNEADARATVPAHYPQMSDDGILIMPSDWDDEEDSVYDHHRVSAFLEKQAPKECKGFRTLKNKRSIVSSDKEKSAWPEAAEKKHRKLNG